MDTENVRIRSKKPSFGMVPGWISEHPELSDRAVRLYAILMRIGDSQDGSSFYGRRNLADRCRCSVDSIDRAVKELQQIGALTVERRFTERGQTSNLWTVDFDEPSRTDAATPPQDRGYPRRKAAAPPAATVRPQYLDVVDLDVTDLNNPPTPQTLSLVPVSAAQTCVDQVFAEWKQATNKTRAVLDPKRRRIIQQALRLYPLEDVVDAVWGWRSSEFHCGINDRKTVYNDLSLLLRNAETIERFRDLRRGDVLSPPSVREYRDQQLMARIRADQALGF